MTKGKGTQKHKGCSDRAMLLGQPKDKAINGIRYRTRTRANEKETLLNYNRQIAHSMDIVTRTTTLPLHIPDQGVQKGEWREQIKNDSDNQ